MQEFLQTPFHEPAAFLRLTGILFAVIYLRYLLLCGAVHYFFLVRWKPQLLARVLNPYPRFPQRLRLDVRRSAFTAAVFALLGAGMVIAWQQGHTRLYTDWGAHPWWMVPLGAAAVLLLHETYYYWLHRWMHHPRVYRLVHQWHHESIETTALSSFSFHPLESILQAAIVPVLVFVVPLHIYTLIGLLLFMTVSAVINHAGLEVYSRHPALRWWARHVIGATHHDQHHKLFTKNYGLYFTFWDRWMRTESEDFERVFAGEDRCTESATGRLSVRKHPRIEKV